MSKTKSTTLNSTESFNTDEFVENVKKGAIVGSISTTSTFSLLDKPLAYATKAATELKNSTYSFRSMAQELFHGNFSAVWNNSAYVQAYRAAWEHPIKGYPVALLNSTTKNSVFFPAKFYTEKAIKFVTSSEETAKMYSSFLAGIATVYITTPISVVKTRMMTNVSLSTLSVYRLMSGVNAIALRDGIQYGVYFNTISALKARYGDNAVVAGMAGILGYILSNPLSVIGLNQKTSPEATNMPQMATTIYKSSGVKGFYPLVGLAAFGCFR